MIAASEVCLEATADGNSDMEKALGEYSIFYHFVLFPKHLLARFSHYTSKTGLQRVMLSVQDLLHYYASHVSRQERGILLEELKEFAVRSQS